MLCSTVQGKMQSPLFSAALQNRLTAGSVSLHLHLWRFALHTGVQWHITNALQQGSGQNGIPTVQCCSAKEAHSRQCVSATTPMEMCTSYRCAVTQHQCTATLFLAKCNPHCSVLQKRLTAGSVSLQLHLLRFALHTGVQWHITYALQHCSGQNAIPTVQ